MAESFFRVRKGIVVSNNSATANLDPISLIIGSTVVNSTGVYAATVNAGTITGITSLPSLATISATQSFNVGALFTANSTLVNAVALNVTNQINAAALFLSGQANVSTLYATTSANVGANVQITVSSISIGNTSVNTFANSSQIRVISIAANGAVGSANQAILSDGANAYWGGVEILGVTRTHNLQTGNYTLALTDAGKTVLVSNTVSANITIPNNATVAFITDTYVNLAQYGAGQITIIGAAGVTIRARVGTHLAGQFAIGTIQKINTDEWILGGDVV